MIFGQFSPLKSPVFRYGGISVGAINSQVKLNESEIIALLSDLKTFFNSSQVRYQTQTSDKTSTLLYSLQRMLVSDVSIIGIVVYLIILSFWKQVNLIRSREYPPLWSKKSISRQCIVLSSFLPFYNQALLQKQNAEQYLSRSLKSTF